LKWPRLQDEPACKGSWCILPRLGRGWSFSLQPRLALPQGQVPVAKASNVRTGMLEQVS